MAFNHFQLFPPNCFEVSVCYMGSCISPTTDSIFSTKQMSSWTTQHPSSRAIMLQKSQFKQQQKSLSYIFTSHTCYWYYSGVSSIFTLYPSSISLLYLCSINNIWRVRNISWPCQWKISIISSSFAWLKPDKHNALCSLGNAFCIIPVFEYISEYLPLVWSQFLAMSFRTDIESHSRMKMSDENECLLKGKIYFIERKEYFWKFTAWKFCSDYSHNHIWWWKGTRSVHWFLWPASALNAAFCLPTVIWVKQIKVVSSKSRIYLCLCKCESQSASNGKNSILFWSEYVLAATICIYICTVLFCFISLVPDNFLLS